MHNPKNIKYFAYGVAISVVGAIAADVVRGMYRRYTTKGASK
ncbi:hypothetical protein [Pseudoalteromonas rubra]|nr:hypothetical protein [Pseudoalteromonas rubra]MEC4091147.1 hypothetical protein [Pseudoalteromonas rubra]